MHAYFLKGINLRIIAQKYTLKAMPRLGSIWREIERRLGKSSKKLLVARKMLLYGLKIKDGNVYCGDVKVTISSLAAACSVDRRTVVETINAIMRSPMLREIFEGIEPSGPFLYNIARLLGYRTLIIEVHEDRPGILASVASALAEANINIVQVVAEDPNLIPNAKLYIIVEGDIPGNVIQKMLKNPIIKRVTVS
ncbi:MAG: ACT domain-containing protein [Thermoproteales archaeon]|nr:ACT domain-containing protein [Thermoproteales archaeon]